jgi:hypothetical protein
MPLTGSTGFEAEVCLGATKMQIATLKSARQMGLRNETTFGNGRDYSGKGWCISLVS